MKILQGFVFIMGKKINIIYFLVGTNLPLCMAQMNLAPNPSFESYSTCPTGIGQMDKAAPWFNPHYIPICGAGSSDYLNQCSGASGAGVPNNSFGTEIARTGVGYAGIYTMNLPWINVREYMEAPLTDTLLAGKEYVVSFYVSLADIMCYATNKIGAYFSDSAIVNSCDSLLPFIPQIVNQQGNSLTSKNGWILVRDTFMATGTETHIIIGNFFPLSQSDTVYVGAGTYTCCSYYYIDDVSVIPLDSLSSIEDVMANQYLVSIFPNPFNSSCTIQVRNPSILPCELILYDVFGKEIFKGKITSTEYKLEKSNISEGIYVINIKPTGVSTPFVSRKIIITK